ncbi:MAG TPA: MerR family transcriptional regulator [Aeromicrobium sp.]|nr:MerR family transcriptional regulator [Aeromicrobium sp.]HKY57591.1 MerR family transcriptional regulator [Aeromicrobium sp.]
MYSIGHAADQVGISPATLRAWERRYAVVQPTRTDGDYRIYSADDIRVLRSMKELIDAGWSSRFAAQEALRRRSEPAGLSPEAATDSGDLPSQFVAATAALDSRQLEELLDRMFAQGSFELVVENHLFPSLRAIGDAWASGRVTVAGEHLASHAVGRRLAAAFDAAASAPGARRILMGLAPGSHHELGLYAFAVAARRRGLAVDYLGADVPVPDWVAACAGPEVAGVVLAVPTERDVAAVGEVVAALRTAHPNLVIATGGTATDEGPQGVLRLDDDIPPAVQALADAVAGARPPAHN